MQQIHRIIFDTDPGVDDTMAIYFALKSVNITIHSITTVFGNVHVDLATENALRILEIAGRDDIPVYRGAAAPLASDYGGPVPWIHGENGQGNIPLEPPTRRAERESAAEHIVAEVMGNPGEITLVGVGPLTNFTLALQIEPEIARMVKEVVIMGGNALCPGNATPHAEANIHNDPEAADLVFAAGWPLTMVGLDVTHKVYMSSADLDRFSMVDDPLARHVGAVAGFYRDFFQREVGVDGIYVHDSSAVAFLLNPELFRRELWPVYVDLSEGAMRQDQSAAPGNGDFKTSNGSLHGGGRRCCRGAALRAVTGEDMRP